MNMSRIVNYRMDLSDTDPRMGGELLSGLMEYDFQLWRFPKDVPGSRPGMTRSCKSSIPVLWLC